MKEQDNDIISLKDAEDLCRLYLDCRLSVVEEKELQYILEKLDYSSPLINKARTSMMAESLISKKSVSQKQTKSKCKSWAVGIAASVAVILTLSAIIRLQSGVNNNQPVSTTISTSRSDNIIIAYEGGVKLNREDSEKAVNDALKKAEKLMAMAEAKVREEEYKRNHIINLTTK
ncbi:MAG: hypothetical protein K2K84_05490 [Muribaculaceae bacterium]|nr:hypothetical protein [Muribaculaceae bacterium]